MEIRLDERFISAIVGFIDNSQIFDLAPKLSALFSRTEYFDQSQREYFHELVPLQEEVESKAIKQNSNHMIYIKKIYLNQLKFLLTFRSQPSEDKRIFDNMYADFGLTIASVDGAKLKFQD